MEARQYLHDIRRGKERFIGELVISRNDPLILELWVRAVGTENMVMMDTIKKNAYKNFYNALDDYSIQIANVCFRKGYSYKGSFEK